MHRNEFEHKTQKGNLITGIQVVIAGHSLPNIQALIACEKSWCRPTPFDDPLLFGIVTRPFLKA